MLTKMILDTKNQLLKVKYKNMMKEKDLREIEEIIVLEVGLMEPKEEEELVTEEVVIEVEEVVEEVEVEIEKVEILSNKKKVTIEEETTKTVDQRLKKTKDPMNKMN